MKKIYSDILLSVMLSFSLSFILFIVIAYFRLETLFLLLSNTQTSSQALLLEAYNAVWLELVALFLMLFFIVFYVTSRLSKRIREEMENLNEYLHRISQKKDYAAPFHVKHYLEFLTISIHLKNVIKRLYNREKKKK